MPKSDAAVGLELVELDERPGIEQALEPLAGGELAVGVLLVDALAPPAELGRFFELEEAVAQAFEVGMRRSGHPSPPFRQAARL